MPRRDLAAQLRCAVFRSTGLACGLILLLAAGVARAEQYALIPMDLTQTNHLKAYGIAYMMLQQGIKVEWLLNYRGGSFLALDHQDIDLESRVRGVLFEQID